MQKSDQHVIFFYLVGSSIVLDSMDSSVLDAWFLTSSKVLSAGTILRLQLVTRGYSAIELLTGNQINQVCHAIYNAILFQSEIQFLFCFAELERIRSSLICNR